MNNNAPLGFAPMIYTFDMPLCSTEPMTKGTLRITYNDAGFLHADYYVSGFTRLPDRLYNTMLQSTLFAPVMEQINAAIENNRRSLIESHDQSILS